MPRKIQPHHCLNCLKQWRVVTVTRTIFVELFGCKYCLNECSTHFNIRLVRGIENEMAGFFHVTIKYARLSTQGPASQWIDDFIPSDDCEDCRVDNTVNRFVFLFCNHNLTNNMAFSVQYGLIRILCIPVLVRILFSIWQKGLFLGEKQCSADV